MTRTPNSDPGFKRSTKRQIEPVSVPESLASIALWLNSNGFTTAIHRGVPRFRPLRRGAPSTTSVWRLTWWSTTPEHSGERGRLWVEVGEATETPSTTGSAGVADANRGV